VSRIYLDASILIYLIDGPAPFREAARSALARYPAAAWTTSAISRLECRVKPLRDKDQRRLEAFDALLDPQRMTLIDVDSDVIAAATGLRAEFGLRTVDAIHAASALRSGCVAALTGDAAWSRVPALRIDAVRQ
jgi:predicted nucleic acid-binding protein